MYILHNRQCSNNQDNTARPHKEILANGKVQAQNPRKNRPTHQILLSMSHDEVRTHFLIYQTFSKKFESPWAEQSPTFDRLCRFADRVLNDE
jgi:hypothetical protein